VLSGERPTMESDVYGFAMILWYMAARETEPFRPKVKEMAYGTIIEGKVSPGLHSLCVLCIYMYPCWYFYMCVRTHVCDVCVMCV